jgi:hypothetical protein
MNLAQEKKIVWLAEDIDINSAGTNPSDGINMSKYHDCLFVVHYIDLGAEAHYVRVQSGATEGAYSSNLLFKYAWGGAALGSANADVYATWASVTAAVPYLSVAHAGYDNTTLLVYIEASQMDVANQEEWLNISFDDDLTNATGQAVVMAILSPRYPSGSIATCLA